MLCVTRHYAFWVSLMPGLLAAASFLATPATLSAHFPRRVKRKCSVQSTRPVTPQARGLVDQETVEATPEEMKFAIEAIKLARNEADRDQMRFSYKVGYVREQLKKELAHGEHQPWEGEFLRGAYEVEFLHLSNGRYTRDGHRYAGDMGAYTVKDSVIALRSLSPSEGRELDTDLVVVPWGKRIYLVESHWMIHFCNQVNSGDEPRNGYRGLSFLKEGGWDLEVDGQPSIPLEFQGYLLTSPVTASIRSFGEERKAVPIVGRPRTFDGMMAILDCLRSKELKPGMELFSAKVEGITIAHVLNVSDDAVDVLLEKQFDNEQRSPAVGSEFSSRCWLYDRAKSNESDSQK